MRDARRELKRSREEKTEEGRETREERREKREEHLWKPTSPPAAHRSAYIPWQSARKGSGLAAKAVDAQGKGTV